MEPVIMPHNIEVEQAVLGTLLMHNEVYTRVADLLTAECFFEPLHQRLFEVAAGLIAQGKTANAITVKTYLGDQDLGGTTVTQYLARLSAESGIPSEIRGYSEILHHLRIRREVISIAEDARERAYNSPVEDTAKSLVDGVLDRLSSLRTTPAEVSGFEEFESASYRAVLAAQTAYQAGGQLVGLSTGLPRLDDALGGLRNTDLIILAGRPAMGKTSLATNISFSVARYLHERRQNGEKRGVVGFFSLEMSSEQLAKRIICEQARVPGWKVDRGFASQEEMERVEGARRELGRLPLLIDQTGGIPISQIRLRAKELKKRRGLELLVIDYLQLIQASQKKGENRVQELTEITSSLKALAKELNVPIIALSQLSRKVEERDDRRPMLADLRESGSIEQDADVVMFVYRDAYYLSKQKAPPHGTEARYQYDRRVAMAEGVAEIIIGKHRHGPETTVELGFEASITKFLDAPEPRDIPPEDLSLKPKKSEEDRLPADATILYGELRRLSLSGEKPMPEHLKADRDLKAKARLVPLEKARERFRQETMPDEPMGDPVITKFRAAFRALRRKNLAFYTGDKETGIFIWCPELVD
jgi:replicative DNA helicase